MNASNRLGIINEECRYWLDLSDVCPDELIVQYARWHGSMIITNSANGYRTEIVGPASLFSASWGLVLDAWRIYDIDCFLVVSSPMKPIMMQHVIRICSDEMRNCVLLRAKWWVCYPSTFFILERSQWLLKHVGTLMHIRLQTRRWAWNHDWLDEAFGESQNVLPLISTCNNIHAEGQQG